MSDRTPAIINLYKSHNISPSNFLCSILYVFGYNLCKYNVNCERVLHVFFNFGPNEKEKNTAVN